MDNGKQTSTPPLSKKSDMLVMILSAMYAKLLVVMGIAFPLAQVISPLIQPWFQKAFHLFLYVVSITFLVYAYLFLMRKRQPAVVRLLSRVVSARSKVPLAKDALNNLEMSMSAAHFEHARNCGSFYLRVGAVAFSIGSMIYTGLEIVQFFEIDPESVCYSILDVINPLSHMSFTFIQLYFIFLNAKMCIAKYKKVARFGLMHLVATNLCVWLLAVIQESKHEILNFYEHPEAHGHINSALPFSSPLALHHSHHVSSINDTKPSLAPTLIPPEIWHAVGKAKSCQRTNIIGELVQKASPFLFPCTIEYSLICAAICYIMWKNIGRPMRRPTDVPTYGRHHHHYRVDCSNAIKGLFTGILVLVMAIISVIVFFVLVIRPEFHDLALMEAHVAELVLFTITSIAPLLAMYRIRHFRYARHRNVELDNILLIVAQTGVYLFSIFSIISGSFKHTPNTTVVLLSSLARLVQATVQTVFILDASQRKASTANHAHKKPGREIITFLLVCNFAMWIINTLKTGRTESSPVQLDFYGFWGWTIVARVSTPLAIFFRFHSTVCLCEIWKKLYKHKPDIMAVDV